MDLTNTLVIVTADHAHTSQILNAQPAYALSTVLKSADGNNMVVSYGTAQEASTDAEGGYNGGDMEHTGTQLRIAASGPGAQRVIGLTDQTDNFYTIAGALGLATSPDEQNALSKDGTVKVARTQAGKYVANVDGFNGDALLSYELKDKDGAVVSKSDSSPRCPACASSPRRPLRSRSTRCRKAPSTRSPSPVASPARSRPSPSRRRPPAPPTRSRAPTRTA